MNGLEGETLARAGGALGAYQHHVKRLTEENQRLRDEMRQLQAGHAGEMRKLRAERDEGLTPGLIVLRRELRRWRERALAAEGRLAAIRRAG